MATITKNSKPFYIALYIILLVGIALRILGASGDLWLDEIWSIRIAEGMKSPWNIFTVFNDNNHPLNTLYLYLIPKDPALWIYRLHSLCAAIAALLLLPSLRLFRNSVAILIATTLFAFSYPLILFSTEARGYGLSLLGVIIALRAVSYITTDYYNKYLVFQLWVGSLLAMLSHYSSCTFLGALYLFLILNYRKLALHKIVLLIVPPILCIIALYYLHIRHLYPGTGAITDPIFIWLQLLGSSFGALIITPSSLLDNQFVVVPAMLLSIILIIEITLSYREQNSFFLLYLLGLIVLPILAIFIYEPRVVYERYFLIQAAIAIIIVANFLSRLFEEKFFSKVLSISLVAFCLLGSSIYLYKFSDYQRGQYSEGLRYISNISKTNIITLSSDHDFRTKTVFDFYSKRLKIPYIYNETGSISDSRFYLAHSQLPDFEYKERIETGGKTYQALKKFPFTALSGWSFSVYIVRND